MKFLKYKDAQDVNNVIMELAQRDRQVIYGQQSVNVQLPSKFRHDKDRDTLENIRKGGGKW